jgi:chemotaxis protein methyltransferase CheR
MHLRWSGFRRVRGQVARRLRRRLADLALADLAAYRAYLDAHPAEWAHLDGLCRVSISRFYRDRAVFDALAGDVLPALASAARARGERTLRAWSAGCASGEEPYTLALLWSEALRSRFPGLALRIVATDADAHLLERARAACYPPSSLRELPEAWTERFAPRGALRCLDRALAESVELRLEDLRIDRPAGSFDLVLCRNVAFTYFDEPLQRAAAGRIADALVAGGALVLGLHEKLPADTPEFEPWDRVRCVYRKRR